MQGHTHSDRYTVNDGEEIWCSVTRDFSGPAKSPLTENLPITHTHTHSNDRGSLPLLDSIFFHYSLVWLFSSLSLPFIIWALARVSSGFILISYENLDTVHWFVRSWVTHQCCVQFFLSFLFIKRTFDLPS